MKYLIIAALLPVFAGMQYPRGNHAKVKYYQKDLLNHSFSGGEKHNNSRRY
jgi:hypothetical protein